MSVPRAAGLANSPGIKECLQSFEREKQWINDRHLQLCRIPAPTFLEQKRAEWMVAQFRSLGWDARLDRGGNVVAQFNSSTRGPYIALTAHLDTVLAPQNSEGVTADRDGTLRGPGVSDNGAGLAALLAVARVLKTYPALLNAPLLETLASVLLVANVGEEGEGNLSGMRFLCCQSAVGRQLRSLLILDGPATSHITCQALASRRLEITFSGAGGHSWSDFGTGNPVHALSRAISAFIDQAGYSQSSAPKTSYNFGLMSGGTSINSIPSEARAKLDIRSEEPGRIDQLANLLAHCVERALEVENAGSRNGRVAAKVHTIGERPGGQLPPDARILTHLQAVDTYLGIRSRLDCASTDANIPLSLQMPALSIGAGGRGGGAHTSAEWFHPEGRDLGLKRILLTLLLLLEDGPIAK